MGVEKQGQQTIPRHLRRDLVRKAGWEERRRDALKRREGPGVLRRKARYDDADALCVPPAVCSNERRTEVCHEAVDMSSTISVFGKSVRERRSVRVAVPRKGALAKESPQRLCSSARRCRSDHHGLASALARLNKGEGAHAPLRGRAT